MENQKSKIGFIISWLIIGIILGAGGYSMANNYLNKSTSQEAINAKLAQEKQNEILSTLGKMIILPSDETPSIFVINDAKTLAKDQPFYKDAVDGDYILVYQKSQQAIVYSESRKIIVNKGPIILQNQQQEGTTAATTSKKK